MAKELVLGVDFDITEAEAKQKELDAKWKSQKQKIEETSATIKKISNELETAKNRLAGTDYQAKELEESLKVCEDVLSRTKPNSMAYKAAQADLELVKQDIEKNKEAQKAANNEVDQLQLKLSKAKIRYADQEAALCKIGAQIQANTQKQKKHNTVTANAESPIKRFGKQLLGLVKSALIFSVITKALTAMRDQIGNLILSSDKLKDLWGKLKGNLQVIGAGLLAPLQPILEWIFQKLIAISNIMVNVISKITGKSVEDMKKLANNTAKAGKEAKKATAGFDTLQTATNESSDSSSNSEAVDTSGITKLSDGIMATVTQMMAIVGGALLVIGLILIATGAGMGLGLGLLLLGAAMIATALTLAWDTLPTEIQNAIAIIMVIVGTAFLVLGAILLFSGTNIPLGLALIVLGAVAIAAPMTAMWDSLSPSVQNAIAIIFAIVSIALLVIGAILLFSGANVPVGLALFVAGAVTLATGMAAKWDSLPPEVQNVILTITAIVSAALLVLGIILAFTGVAIPLGIALMVLGAVGLATAAKMAWGSLTPEVKNMIATISSIVGAALLVIGVILICTGVGIPLGIALIVAGVAAMVAGVLMGDGMIERVKKVLSKIKEIFSGFFSNITDRFKSFINKIIDFLNGIIDGLNDLIMPVRAVIWGVMKLAGKDVSMDDISIPHIPHLATGAVLPGGKPFTAIVNDQPVGQTNIEAPLDTIKQALAEVMAEINPNFTIEATGSMAQLIHLLRLEIKKEDRRATVW